MANPVVTVGVPGSANYRVDWSPLAQGWADLGRGIGDIFGGIKEFEDRRNTATLSEMFAAKAAHDELVDFAGKRGLLPQLGEMLTTRRALAPPPRKTAKDASGRLRYLDDGSFAFPDMAGFQKDARTNEQKNLDRFLERNPGKTPADYFAMKRPGLKIDARTMGTIPTDHRVVYDERGRLSRYEVIPGSPTARKMQEAEAKATGRQEEKTAQADLVGTHIARIREKIAKGAGPFGMIPLTGMAGAAMEHMPGTKAHDVSKLVDTLKANIGFDALQTMRQNSPTGGSLGAISEKEIKFLQSTIASLEQSQSEEQFLENLALVEQAFNRVVHGPPRQRQYMQGGGADAVMQSLGLSGFNPGPAPPAQAATLSAVQAGDYADKLFSGAMQISDLSGLGIEARNAIRAELVRRSQ